jgi:hypothetical protein
MIALRLVLMIVGLLLFAAAAVGIQSRINLQAAGLFFWLLAVVVS